MSHLFTLSVHHTHCRRHGRLHTCITSNGGARAFAEHVHVFNGASGRVEPVGSLIVVLEVPGKGSSEHYKDGDRI